MRNNLVSLMLSDTTSQRAQSAAVHCRRPNSFRPASTFFGICRGMRLAYRLCTVGCDSFHNVAQGLWCSTTGRCDPHLGSGSSSAPDHFSPWGSTWDEQWRSGSYGTATFWWHIGSDPFFFFFFWKRLLFACVEMIREQPSGGTFPLPAYRSILLLSCPLWPLGCRRIPHSVLIPAVFKLQPTPIQHLSRVQTI